MRLTLEYRKTPARAIPVPALNPRTRNILMHQEVFDTHIHKRKTEAANLPRELMGETGVWKKITELTMTTTRFTQLPTEWVTGDTLCNIM